MHRLWRAIASQMEAFPRCGRGVGRVQHGTYRPGELVPCTLRLLGSLLGSLLLHRKTKPRIYTKDAKAEGLMDNLQKKCYNSKHTRAKVSPQQLSRGEHGVLLFVPHNEVEV